jgi:hypothetical protein
VYASIEKRLAGEQSAFSLLAVSVFLQLQGLSDENSTVGVHCCQAQTRVVCKFMKKKKITQTT